MLLPTTGCLVANPAWLGDEGADDSDSASLDSTSNPGGDDSDDDDDDAMGTVGPPTGGGTGTGGPGEGEDTDVPLPETTADPPPADWWDTAWQFRRQVQVTLDTTIERPTAVPIQIDGSNDPLRFAELGRDVRFVTSSGEHVPHEIDTWQPIDGSAAIVWLRIEPGPDQESLYMYYGNPSATAGDGPALVWTPELSAVWHLSSDVDSTLQTDPLDPLVEVGPGVLGDGADFGPGSEIAFTNFGDVAPASATITAWILPMGPGEEGEGRIVDVVIPAAELSVALHITSFTGQADLAVTTINGGASQLSALTQSPLDLGAWHFVALTINDKAVVELFVDGEGGVPEPLIAEPGLLPMIMDPTIAIGGPVDGQPQRFEGTIDEVRVRPENLPAEQILAEYLSQQTSAALLGAEESL